MYNKVRLKKNIDKKKAKIHEKAQFFRKPLEIITVL